MKPWIEYVSERVVVKRTRTPPKRFTSSRDIFEFARTVFDSLDDGRENFVVLAIDQKNRPLGWKVVSIGHQTSSLVHPRETFRWLVASNAAFCVLMHNHPSGDVEPSHEDHEITKRLYAAGEILGIGLIDHIVVDDEHENYTSFLDRGWIG